MEIKYNDLSCTTVAMTQVGELNEDTKTEVSGYNSHGIKNHLVIGNTPIDTQPWATNLGYVLEIGLMRSVHAVRMCKSVYITRRCIRKINLKNCININIITCVSKLNTDTPHYIAAFLTRKPFSIPVRHIT